MRLHIYKTKTFGPIISDGKLRTSDKEMEEAFNDYLCNLMTLSSSYGIDEIWEAIASSKRDSAAGPDGLKMAVFKAANDYLIKPLQIMFNTINYTGLIPANFKTAKVVMLHKKNSKQEMGNYRPISMSNHISKLWERVFNLRLMLHLKRHNRLSKQQHGFRPKMGCHTNLLESWEKVSDLADEHRLGIEI